MTYQTIPKISVDKDHFMMVVESRGSTVAEIAENPMVDVTVTCIYKWLRRGEMSRTLLNNIAMCLKVHPLYLSGHITDSKVLDSAYAAYRVLLEFISSSNPTLIDARTAAKVALVYLEDIVDD